MGKLKSCVHVGEREIPPLWLEGLTFAADDGGVNTVTEKAWAAEFTGFRRQE